MHASLEMGRQGKNLRPALLLVEKHYHQGELNSVTPGKLKEEVSQWPFLINTGAVFSILPSKGLAASDLSRLPRLKSAGGQAIACFGKQALLLVFNGQQFNWDFILVDVESPFIGADFLKHHHLVVDLHAGHLIHAESLQCIGCGGSAHPSGIGGDLAAVVEFTALCLWPFNTILVCWALLGFAIL